MAITLYQESSLGTSEVWKTVNSIYPNETLLDRAMRHIKGEGKILTSEDIEPAYIAVKQITDSLTAAAIHAFDMQKVKMVYCRNPKQSINQAVPFLTFKAKSGYLTYLFVNNRYVTNDDGVYRIQAPILRDLLTGATVANAIRSDYEKLRTNAYLQKILMNTYTAFVARILNRGYSIMSDKILFDKIQFWVNKFFLIHIFGVVDSDENIDTMASAHVRYLDQMALDDAKEVYKNTDPKQFSELIELLRAQVSRMKALNMGQFLSSWVNYFYPASMLAVDNIEYLIFMMLCLLSGTNIISVAAAEVVTNMRNIKQFRGELLKLI